MQLWTQLVEQRSVKAERHHSGDAIRLELFQLLHDDFSVVVFGRSLEADEDADMRVVGYESGDNGFAGVVDDLGAIRDWGAGGRTNSDNAPITDDDRRIVQWSTTASIDDTRTAKDGGLRICCDARPNENPQGDPDQ